MRHSPLPAFSVSLQIVTLRETVHLGQGGLTGGVTPTAAATADTLTVPWASSG